MQNNFDNNFLYKSNTIYEHLLEHIHSLYKKGRFENTLKCIQLTADYAWKVHTGRYTDGRIENIAFDIGQNLNNILKSQKLDNYRFNLPAITNKYKKRNILHIATRVSKIGGHTRLINNWIKQDTHSSHSLVIVNQTNLEVPEWIDKSISKSGGKLILIPPNISLLLKAKLLRELSNSNIDLIILHHHPNDIVPVVAFSVKNCPPVAIQNHADHVFWLGSSIGDIVINIRKSGQSISVNRRHLPKNFLLPIPIDIKPPPITKESARKQLNIKQNDILLLSIGMPYKFIPSGNLNFFKTIIKVLNSNPNIHLFIIGFDKEYIKYIPESKHERIKLLGRIVDPSIYYKAADLYLESFPVGSLTTLLEAVILGLYPVLSPRSTSTIFCCDDISLEGYVNNSHSENEYISKIKSLIQHPTSSENIITDLTKKVSSYHNGKIWNEYLSKFYNTMSNLLHNPRKIGAENCTKYLEDKEWSSLNRTYIDNNSILLTLLNGKKYFCRFEDPYELTINDLFRLILISIKSNDTRIISIDFIIWIKLLISKINIKRIKVNKLNLVLV